MAENMAAKKAAKKAATTANPVGKKAAVRPGPRAGKGGGEAAVLAKIAAMPAPYPAMGERLHALILRGAPALQPTTFYGMPGYAKDGKTVCFFRADKKYMTFGFTQEANLTREEGAPHQLIESAWYFTRWTTRLRPSSPPSCAKSRAEGARSASCLALRGFQK